MSGRTKSPGFKETFLELYDAFDAAGVKVLRAIARFLKVDEDYFTDTVRDGNSVMRLLHYPAQTEPTGKPYPRRRARGHQHHHPAARRRGSGAGAEDQGRPLDPGVSPSRASW